MREHVKWDVCARTCTLPIRFAEAFAMVGVEALRSDGARARDSNDFKLRPFPNTLTAHSRDHSTWSLGMTSNGLKDILQSAVQLNKDHQYALNVYAERLEAELEAVDKLLVSLAGLGEVVVI